MEALTKRKSYFFYYFSLSKLDLFSVLVVNAQTCVLMTYCPRAGNEIKKSFFLQSSAIYLLGELVHKVFATSGDQMAAASINEQQGNMFFYFKGETLVSYPFPPQSPFRSPFDHKGFN